MVLLGAPLGDGLGAYGLGLPAIALCTCWLAAIATEHRSRVVPLAVSVLLLAPALGFRLTRFGIDSFEVPYLPSDDAFFDLLSIAAASPRGTGPLLLGAAIAAAIGLGRPAGPLVGAGLGGAVAAWLSRLLLSHAAHTWREGGAVGLGVREAGLAGWICLLATLGAALGWAWARPLYRQRPPPPRLRRVPLLLSVLIGLCATWAAQAPVQLLARTLPLPALDASVQRLPQGRAYAALALPPPRRGDPPQELDRQVEALGFRAVRDLPWPCQELPPFDWANAVRNSVVVPMSPERPVRELTPVVAALLRHGVYQVVLPGRSPPLPGALGERVRWTGVGLYLDRPPPGVRWLVADANGSQALSDTPWFDDDLTVCALLPDPDMSVGQLAAVARRLSEPSEGGPCRGALALVLDWPWQDPSAPLPRPGCGGS